MFKTRVEVAFHEVAGVYGNAKVAQVAHERVAPENESGDETVVFCTTPPAVTERSADETASTRRLFALSCDETYAKVDVAFVVVPIVTSRYASDDEAADMKPAVLRMVVEVAVHEVAGVNGYPKIAAPSDESDEAPIAPVGETVTMLLVALPIPETVRFEVVAAPKYPVPETESAVDEA